MEHKIWKDYITKTFKSGETITVGGLKWFCPPERAKEFYQNDIYWLKKLQSKWVAELLDYNDEKQTITLKYYGPSLLGAPIEKDWKYQIIDMYKFFKKNNIYKGNGSLYNLTNDNGQIRAFDFKWTRQRPHGIEMEIQSYKEWLSKIDKNLTEILMNDLET